MSSIKPITLYTHATGPNPWKVAIILKELDLPYEEFFMEMADLKKEPYQKLNPNGRVPTIVDPNTGITISLAGLVGTTWISRRTRTTIPGLRNSWRDRR